MILQALNRYYQILLEEDQKKEKDKREIPPPGYSMAKFRFAVVLSKDGRILGLTPLLVEEKRGKRVVERPRELIVPEQVLRSGRKIAANFLWDNVTYALGVSEKDEERPDYAAERFQAFKALNLSLLKKADCQTAKTMIQFLENHDPALFRKSDLFRENEKDLMTANLVFKIINTDDFVHDDPVIQRIWETYLKENIDAPVGQCLVTGEETYIELTHSKIKGIPGGQSSGTAIVSFNERAYESFNRTNAQGLNAPVSKEAMFGYTTALNHLLRSQQQKIVMGDTTVVFWAESPDESYVDLYTALLNPPTKAQESAASGRDARAEARLAAISKKIRSGQPLDESQLLEGLNGETRFYVLGLSPNAARVSVRFFYHNPFKKAIQNLAAHHKDMAILTAEGENRPYAIWQIVRETVSPKAKNSRPAPLLAGAIFRSIFTGLPYPAALLNAIMIRVRADQTDKKAHIQKINHLRAAVIKACLRRKYRHQTKYQKELKMTLNKDSDHQAYLLGRLFAVLEKAQQDALGKDINATIKDRYFTSACATPATTFPILLRLAQHHITKADYGYVSDRRIQEIMERLDLDNDPFPKHLSLDEQGIFVLGYYHQRADFYKKTTETEAKEEKEN